MKYFSLRKTAGMLSCIGVLFFGSLHGGSGIPVIPRVKNPPPMDGKFNAETWNPALELKLRTRDGKSEAPEPGSILLCRDAKTLYAAAIMKAEDVPALLKRRESDSRKLVCNVNRIEMFMGGKAWLQFMMDWMGRINKNCENSLFAKINHKKDSYIVRVAIPLFLIPRSVVSDDIVNMNFYRQSASGISCWSPNTGRSFLDPEKMAPVLLDTPETLVRKLAEKNRKTVSSLAEVRSLTEADAAELFSLIAEKEKTALEQTGNYADFLTALTDFNTIGPKISARQQKNLRGKFGTKKLRLAEESGKNVPALWKPAKLLGRDFWYAFTMIGPYILNPMEQAGMMKLPLFRESMFHLRFFQGRFSDALVNPDGFYYKSLHKYPDNPILVGIDRSRIKKGDVNAGNLFSREYMEKFIKLYGTRLAGFGSPESFLCGVEMLYNHIRHWKLRKPRNRAEAYGVMKTLHDTVTDTPPEYPSFRNAALNSRHARRYAGYNASADSFNHMMYSLGDKISGNENGECMGPTPTKYAFARGAARQYGGIWENYQIYYGWAFLKNQRGSMLCMTSSQPNPGIVEPLLTPDCRTRAIGISGLKTGTGLERQKALILHPYLCGAGIWRSEADLYELVSFYDMDTIGKDDPLVINLRDQKVHISPMAKINVHFYDNIVKKRDRGVTVTPVALVFDRHHGYFPLYLGGFVWGFFPPNEMEKTMWALDSHIFKRVKDNNAYTTSRFGDIFDVITNDSKTDFLKTYQVLYLTGDVTLDKAFASRLQDYVKAGGTLVVNAELLKKYNTPGPDFTGCAVTEQTGMSNATYSLLSGTVIQEQMPYEYRVIKPQGKAQVLAVTTDTKQNPAVILNRVGKGRVVVTAPFHMKEPGSMTHMLALFDHLMDKLRYDSIPVKVETPMQYSFNRNGTGWIVYLQNNSGLPPNRGIFQKPLKCDVSKVEKARIAFPVSMGKIRKIIDWWTGREIPFNTDGKETVAEVSLPGGDCCALEFVME